MNVIENNNNNRAIFVDSNESNSKSSTSNNNSLGGRSRVCLKTVDGFHYVTDPHVWGFCRTCLEYFMEKGQGLFGKAYASNQLSFESNVKSYKKTDYLLGHYVRLFGLSVMIVTCLQSIHTSSDEYILEFFLLPTCVDSQEQEVVLNSLSITMQHVCVEGCTLFLKATQGFLE
jgi:hypothetical protein